MSLAAATGLVALLCAVAWTLGFLCGKRGEPAREKVETYWRHRHPEPPRARPIETVVADLRRRAQRYHGLDPGASYAKVAAVRGAYDHTLAECCAALGLTHLLEVLPVGPELDAERERVEGLLGDAGVRLPHAA